MDINNQKNLDNDIYAQNELDFEKMNATLANPEFANWYYNQMSSKGNENKVSIDDFVKAVRDYSEQKFE